MTSRSSESSDNSEDADQQGGVGTISLNVSRLESFHAMSTVADGELSHFAQEGQSRSRIKDALQNPTCLCKCTLPERDLMAVCRCFWRLPKQSQDAILWSIQAEASGRHRNQWILEGDMSFPNVLQTPKDCKL